MLGHWIAGLSFLGRLSPCRGKCISFIEPEAGLALDHLVGHEVPSGYLCSGPRGSALLGPRCRTAAHALQSIRRCRVHHFAMGSLTAASTSSQPKPVPIPSLSFAWFPFLGFGCPMLDPAGVCWQEPVTTPPFRCGWTFLPWVPLVVFPGIAVGSWLARAKRAGPSPAFREQGTDSGGNLVCAPVPSHLPTRCPKPLQNIAEEQGAVFGMCLWDGSVTPRSPVPGVFP